MENINDIISSLSPQDISRLQAMADEMFGGGSSHAEDDEPEPVAAGNTFSDGGNCCPPPGGSPGKGSDASPGADTKASQSAGGAFADAGIDPETLQRLIAMMSAFNSNRRDSRCDLIEALKPHLSGSRRSRADEAMRLLRLFDVMGTFMGDGKWI